MGPRQANWPLRAGLVLLIATAGVGGILLGSGARGPTASGARGLALGPNGKDGSETAPKKTAPAKPAAPTASMAARAGPTASTSASTSASAPANQPPPAVVPLGPVPNPALVAPSPNGPLPIIGKNGLEPWQAYARPFHEPAHLPRIALVIDNMGMDKYETNAAIQKLPPSVTLTFSPYAPNLQSWVAEARAFGHEVMLQLPMEPAGYPANDPGPNALLTSLSAQQNTDRLDWLLGRFTGYIGVTDFRGDAFAASAANLMPVLRAIKARGLMFLDSRAGSNSLAGPLAREIGLPVAVSDERLDKTPARSDIQAALTELETAARADGAAVGVGLPYPVTVDTIDAWAANLSQAGIELAPLSAVANRQKTR